MMNGGYIPPTDPVIAGIEICEWIMSAEDLRRLGFQNLQNLSDAEGDAE